jgi:hypothetical protein
MDIYHIMYNEWSILGNIGLLYPSHGCIILEDILFAVCIK